MDQNTSKKVGVGLIGSQFISTIHAEALKSVADAKVVAAMSPNEEHVRTFCKSHNIPNYYTKLEELLSHPEVQMIVIGAPNYLHCEITEKAAKAGKHVVVEKPFCMNLAEADRMIDACAKAKVKLMYAEELCFTPKYVRLKNLLDEGALGKPVLFKQSEKHDGPHADHLGRGAIRWRSNDGHGLPCY